MKSTRLEPSHCPYCKTILDAVLDLQGHSPNPGDITICNVCGEISELDEDLHLKEISTYDLQKYFEMEPMLREQYIQIRRILGLMKTNPEEN